MLSVMLQSTYLTRPTTHLNVFPDLGILVLSLGNNFAIVQYLGSFLYYELNKYRFHLFLHLFLTMLIHEKIL